MVISSAKTFVSAEINEPVPEKAAAAPVFGAAGGADAGAPGVVLGVSVLGAGAEAGPPQPPPPPPEKIDCSSEAMCSALLFCNG